MPSTRILGGSGQDKSTLKGPSREDLTIKLNKFFNLKTAHDLAGTVENKATNRIFSGNVTKDQTAELREIGKAISDEAKKIGMNSKQVEDALKATANYYENKLTSNGVNIQKGKTVKEHLMEGTENKIEQKLQPTTVYSKPLTEKQQQKGAAIEKQQEFLASGAKNMAQFKAGQKAKDARIEYGLEKSSTTEKHAPSHQETFKKAGIIAQTMKKAQNLKSSAGQAVRYVKTKAKDVLGL